MENDLLNGYLTNDKMFKDEDIEEMNNPEQIFISGMYSDKPPSEIISNLEDDCGFE